MTVKKLTNGYWVIVNGLGETVKYRNTYNTVIFEFRDIARLTAKRLKLTGLSKDLTF